MLHTYVLFTDAAWRQLSFYLSCGHPPRRRPVSKPKSPLEQWQPAAPASTSHTRAPVLLHCCMAADNGPSQQQRATHTPQAAVTRPDQQQQQLGGAAAVPAHRHLEQQQHLSAGTQPLFWLHVWAGGGEHREQRRTVARLPDVCSRWAVSCVAGMRLRIRSTGVWHGAHLRASQQQPWRVLPAQAPPTTLTDVSPAPCGCCCCWCVRVQVPVLPASPCCPGVRPCRAVQPRAPCSGSSQQQQSSIDTSSGIGSARLSCWCCCHSHCNRCSVVTRA